MSIDNPQAAGTSGIALRPLEPSDIAAWYRYLSIPQAIDHTSWNLGGREERETRLSRCESDEPCSPVRLTIVDTDSSRLVGTTGLRTISSVNRPAELAYDLSPQCWGRGIATPVCSAVTPWSFAALPRAAEVRLRLRGPAARLSHGSRRFAQLQAVPAPRDRLAGGALAAGTSAPHGGADLT